MKQYVITLSRQFGSLGRTIAQQLAEELEIDFYDRDIVEETAKRMGLPVSVISSKEENSNNALFKRQYPLGMEEKEARKMIREVDRSRELYHRRYCPEYNGPSTNKDLMIDSSAFGVEKTVELLAYIARDRFGEQ